MFSSCRLLMWLITVSRFFGFFFKYKLYCWFSRLKCFTPVIFGTLLGLLFCVSQNSCLRQKFDLYNGFYFTNCNFDGELSHWHSYHIFLYLFVLDFNFLLILSLVDHPTLCMFEAEHMYLRFIAPSVGR